MKKPLVGIIMGSDSDLPVMQDAAKMLEEFGVPYELTIVSAHRTPHRLVEYAETAAKRGLKVIIAGAGGAAHLPGMCASHSELPIIGVPITTKVLQGLDSLLSIVQMPPGVPVATVGTNGAKNAGILAAQILGTKDDGVRKKVAAFKKKMRDEVEKKAQQLEETGFQRYLQGKGPL
jgi:5-(carboxyamino)imidazole ribonucleotide mutase